MKRILSLILSFTILLTCFSFSVSANNGKQLLFELSSNGESTIVVDAGEEFTVDFYVQNTTDDDDFGITTLENQIEYKREFFEFVSADLEAGPAYWAKDGDCSWDRTIKWLEIMSSHYPAPAAYNNRQLVTRVTFKVNDGIEAGSSGILSSKACYAAYGSAEHTTSTKDLEVFVGRIPDVTHTLTYISEGNVINESKDLAHGETVKIYGALPDMENKKFVGWVDENQVVWEAGADYTVEGDMTFTAKWQEYPKYTLTFNTNNGSEVEPVVEYVGTTVDLSSKVTTKAHHTFAGWYLDEALTQEAPDTITLNGNTTVYAKWTENKFTLTFNTYGGTAIADVTDTEGKVIDLTTYTTSKSGYTFNGWYLDEALTQYVTSVTLNANITVYAKWTKKSGGGGGGGFGGGGGVSVPEKHTITLTDPDGNKIEIIDSTTNKVIILDKYRADKDGYIFDGWYLDEGLTNKVTSIKVTKDITLYAKWNKITTPSKDMLTSEHYAYIVGREDGRIEPMANISRAEVATIFFRLLNEKTRNESLSHSNAFDDVDDDDWFNTAVSTLSGLGIIKGRTEAAFEPNAYITRAEFTTIASRFSNDVYDGEDMFSDISEHWAKDYINSAASIGWVIGDSGRFRPDDSITRAEVMTIVNRVLNRLPESESDMSDEMTRWEDNADKNAWYYVAVQEATNSHNYEMKSDGVHEKWTEMTQNPDWTEFEK